MRDSTINVVAIRKGQEVSAPLHADWGVVRCPLCEVEFVLGKHRGFGAREEKEHYVKGLQQILAGEHSREEKPEHLNHYGLGE